MRQDKDKALAFLQNVAISETVNEYHANLRTLKISNIWTRPNSVTFRNWIEKTWLLLDKVCFSCSFKIKANLKSKLKF